MSKILVWHAEQYIKHPGFWVFHNLIEQRKKDTLIKVPIIRTLANKYKSQFSQRFGLDLCEAHITFALFKTFEAIKASHNKKPITSDRIASMYEFQLYLLANKTKKQQ